MQHKTKVNGKDRKLLRLERKVKSEALTQNGEVKNESKENYNVILTQLP